jgi:hypothetical protein
MIDTINLLLIRLLDISYNFEKNLALKLKLSFEFK